MPQAVEAWYNDFAIIIYSIILVIVAIVGAIGNLIILIVLFALKPKKNPFNILMVNLCVADGIISGFVLGLTVIGSFHTQFFRTNEFLCKSIASICLITCVSSISTIAIISFSRYVKLCHTKHYEKVFSRNKTICFCIFAWIMGVLVDLPNFLGWGGHWYDPKTYSCLFDRTASLSYSIFFGIVCIVLPCVVIGFFYSKIFIVIFNSKSRIHRNDKSAFAVSARISTGMFLTYLIFAFCWLPFALMIIIDYEDKLNRGWYMWSMQLAHTNSSISPFLYYYTNAYIENGVNAFFNDLICCGKESLKISKLDTSARMSPIQETNQECSVDLKNWEKRETLAALKEEPVLKSTEQKLPGITETHL